MRKIAFSVVSLMAVTALSAGTDGVNTKLQHGKDAAKVSASSESVDDLSSMFSEGTVSGQIRMFYVDRKYQGSLGVNTHRATTALGGHLKFETAKFNGFNMAAAFYTTQDTGLNPYDVQDPSLLGTGLESYSILGEGYIGYSFADLGYKTDAKLGYQRYDVPMMGSDDARMLPNTFRAYKLVSHDITNTTLQIAHVDRIAYGTFRNVYSFTGTNAAKAMLATTSGYPANGEIEAGKYYNLGMATVGKKTDGVTNVLVKYTTKHFHVKVSNDYAWDMYNTLYADAGTSWDCLLNSDIHPFLQAQIIKQNSVGAKYMKNLAESDNGEIDSLYWAAKFGAKYAGFAAYIAYSQTSENSDTDIVNNQYKNAIISQFGGMPAYTQGMVTRHQFLAGTKATKVAAVYSFKNLGVNLSAAAYYTSFGMDKNSGYGIARTATEPGFDIKYYPKALKNKLQLRFRGNFPRKFYESTSGDLGWNEYRFIANYNF
ncbi:OprD family outer membrane porin [Sulfurimonas sp. NWX79]|uniref:OprD family outer membrane porin n=1 Tax=Sulfurimonas sp. NWX79 TaxID=2925412 RepID=UPI0032046A77